MSRDCFTVVAKLEKKNKIKTVFGKLLGLLTCGQLHHIMTYDVKENALNTITSNSRVVTLH